MSASREFEDAIARLVAHALYLDDAIVAAQADGRLRPSPLLRDLHDAATAYRRASAAFEAEERELASVQRIGSVQ